MRYIPISLVLILFSLFIHWGSERADKIFDEQTSARVVSENSETITFKQGFGGDRWDNRNEFIKEEYWTVSKKKHGEYLVLIAATNKM
ncbi:MAG: hypothetical protein WC795_00495 [Candidatus Paceibacterota bacterium]|jgi:hypothetical protein